LFGHATSGYTVIGRRRSKAGLLSKEDVIGSVSSTDQGGGKRRGFCIMGTVQKTGNSLVNST